MLHLNEDYLKQMSYLAYLKEMKEKVKSISHTKKSDTGYNEALQLVDHIIYRYIRENKKTWQNYNQDNEGSMLFNDKDILTKYDRRSSDKQNSYVIEEFKDNLNDDLFDMITSLENIKE